LTGRFRSPDALPDGDARKGYPRFSAGHFEHNLQLVHLLEQVARKLQRSPAQVALAWVLCQGNDVVPLFGTRTAERVQHNAGAIELRLTPEILDRLDGAFAAGAALGDRYPDMSTVNR
jgi:aryl-alcohol dehydrogenase-like predicted oxidoreductase